MSRAITSPACQGVCMVWINLRKEFIVKEKDWIKEIKRSNSLSIKVAIYYILIP
jgi:hypothetical protein